VRGATSLPHQRGGVQQHSLSPYHVPAATGGDGAMVFVNTAVLT
jgi:hypothetical protein